MIRVALLPDYREENWPSMDHCATMLETFLRQEHSAGLQVTRLQPGFYPCVTRLGKTPLAWQTDRLWNRMVTYPALLRRHTREFDLFHILDHSYAHLALGLPPHRTLITCHDLDTFRCLFAPEQEPRPPWFKAMARHILRGFKQARHVIFVSQAVREQALALALVHPDRSGVIGNGADEISPPGEAAAAEADQALQALLGPWAGAPLLLHVGSTVPRKRIEVLLHVFAGVAAVRPQLRLVRVGGSFTESQRILSNTLGVDNKILHLPWVDRATLHALYRRATLLLHPSEREGFGLPVAEAMAAGCPAVVSDLPVLREVGSDAAIYSPLDDVSSWTSTVLRLLDMHDREPASWQALTRRSQQAARRFRWSENARLVAALYRQAAGCES